MSITDRSYKFEGGRTGVLLIHGLGGTPIEMRYVAMGLAREGFTVHAPQLAGHCGTEADIKATRWADWYASVESALAELRKRCDTVVVGGLSAGAILALHLAANHKDDVHGLALYAPTLWLDGWSVPWYARLFDLVQTHWFANKINFVEREPYGIKDSRLRQMVKDALLSGDSSQAGFFSTPGGPMLELRRLVKVVLGELSSIKQPALILHPREDDRSSIRNSFHLQRNLGGLVDMVVLEDSYHIITVDRQRDIVVGRSVSFTSWLSERRARSIENERLRRSARGEEGDKKVGSGSQRAVA